MAKHIIIYSHGFGVRKDDRGLFTDIAAGLPNVESVMFGYNGIDEANNTITVTPLDAQAQKLQEMIAKTRAENPDAIIDLVCHSQGCVVAALAGSAEIRKTIFTAPPVIIADTERKIKELCTTYNVAFTKEEVVRISRKDGSTTIIPPEYWRVCDDLDAQEMYNQLAKVTNLTIITATEDEVLSSVVFNRLSPEIKVIEIKAGHNFEGESRAKLIEIIADELEIEHV